MSMATEVCVQACFEQVLADDIPRVVVEDIVTVVGVGKGVLALFDGRDEIEMFDEHFRIVESLVVDGSQVITTGVQK